jgi:SWI/SNF-related matrix-associated actin-dependent regulator 1 of chromatin subfamily A
VADRKTPRRLYLQGTELVLAFGFDSSLLDEVRRLGRWDAPGKVWRVPMTKLDETLAFARANSFKVSDEVEYFRSPPPPVEREFIDIEGRMIRLVFSWEMVRAAEAKKIPGCSFDDRRKCWTAPLAAIYDVLRWADRFGIPTAEGLRERAEMVEKRRRALYEASYRREFREIEGMHPSLDPHQRAAVAYVASTRRTFIADDIGLGKTFEVIASLDFTDEPDRPSYPALIVAPPKLTLNWVKEFALWSPGRTVQVLGKKKDELGSPDVVVVGWALLHHFRDVLAQRGFRAYVLDESHSGKNKGAQRTRAAITVSKKLAPDAVRLALSGTPIGIGVNEFVPQLEVLGLLDEFGGTTGFERTFCGGGLDSAGRWNTKGLSNEEVLNLWLRGIGYIRRTRDEVLDLPDVLHGDILVEGDLRAYRKAERDIIAYVMERAAEIAKATGEDIRSATVRAKLRAEAGRHFVEMSALRREAGLAKLPAVHEWTERIVGSGRKLILAAHHREVVDALADRWGGLKIQGGMKTADVEAAKKRFQEAPQSEAPVIVLSIEAGKEGHTLTAATEVAFVEFPPLSTTYDQTWGRAWRKGQTQKVNVTAILLDGTRDAVQFDALGIRRRRVKAATDGAPMDSSPALVLSLFDQGLARQT